MGLGASGALYVGVNLEFARLPLYNSVHAEQFLLVNALHHGEREIRRLAVSAAPCGHCRQFYSELACAVGGRGGGPRHRSGGLCESGCRLHAASDGLLLCRGLRLRGGHAACWASKEPATGSMAGRRLYPDSSSCSALWPAPACHAQHGQKRCACASQRGSPCVLPASACIPSQETVRFSFQGGTYSLGQLLPMRFKPQDLLSDPPPPLLLEQQDNRVQLTPAARATLQQRSHDPAFVRAAAEALAAAVGSYAPYSRCPAGVAIVTAGGDVYSGGYVESAAYNPSLPPLQTAIIDAVIGGFAGQEQGLLFGCRICCSTFWAGWMAGRCWAPDASLDRASPASLARPGSMCRLPLGPSPPAADGMPCYTAAHEVVLVELADGAVQHALTTRVALEQIAPQAKLTVLQAEWVPGDEPAHA